MIVLPLIVLIAATGEKLLNYQSIRKWTSWGLLFLAIIAAGSFLWADRQLNRFAGAHTQVADPPRFTAPPQRLAITNVSVLSPDGNTMIDGQTVLLDKGRIVSITGSRPDGMDVKRIDGSGRYLIPGLADAHVHLRRSPNDLLLYVANGVTRIFEMSGNPDHLAWRDDIANGRVGPRMYVASQKLGTWGWADGLFQRWTRNRINVNTQEQADAQVHSLATQGYDAVKLGSFLSPGMYQAVNQDAKAAGITVVGHLPLQVTLDQLWASNQSDVAHVEELVKALDREFGGFNSRNADAFLSFVARRSDEVAKQLRDHHIAVTTTIWLIQSIPEQKFNLEALLGKTRLRYANPGLIEGTRLSPGWLPGNSVGGIQAGTSPDDIARIRTYWQTYARAHQIVLAALDANGVQVMAGTDADNAVVVPGFSLHDELQAMHASGMSNASSLRAATSAPGQWLQDRSGTIAPGNRADLVLLRSNPLVDIANTSHIDAVILGGQVLDRGKLDAMLASVEQANDRSRSINIDAFE